MATRHRIGPRKPRRVFHKEWRLHLGMTLEEVANRISENGVAKATVHRWEKEPWRLEPGIMAALAEVYGIKVEELWHPPRAKSQGPSVDMMLEDAPEEIRSSVQDFVARLLKRA